MSIADHILDTVVQLPLHGLLILGMWIMYKEIKEMSLYFRGILDRLLEKELDDTRPTSQTQYSPEDKE